MKLNKVLTLAALVAAGLCSGTALQAQDATNAAPATTPAARPHRLTPDQLATKLGLSDDVAAKFKTIWQDQMTQLRDLRNDSSLSDDDKKAKRKEITDATQAKLKDILTPDQLAQLKKLTPNRQRVASPVVKPDAGTTPPPGN